MNPETPERKLYRILIVDDSPEDREMFRRLLAQCTANEYHVEETESAADALNACMRSKPACVLIDYKLPDGDGLKLLKKLADHAGDPFLPVVMMTGYGSELVAVEAMKQGAMDYIAKAHITAEAVCRTVDKAIERAALLRIIRRQEEEKDELIRELKSALEQVKTLRGIIPMCANCKQVRDDKGYWQQVEAYLSDNTDAQFTHGLCPDCIAQLYPTVADGVLKRLRGEA